MNNTFETHDALYKCLHVKRDGNKYIVCNGERELTAPLTPKEAVEMLPRLEKVKRFRD